VALATLSIDIEARLAKLEAGLDKAARMADKRAADIEKSFLRVQGTLKNIGGALGGYFSVRYFEGLINGAIDAQDNLNDLAKKAQVSVESIGSIGFAAGQAGADVGEATAALGKLNLQLGKAASGDKESLGLFKKIGVDALDAAGNARKADVVFAELADKFGEWSEGPEKAAVGMAIFGKSYQSILPLLSEGGDSLRENTEYWKKYSGITDESAAAADRYRDATGKLHLLQSAVGTQLANSLLPSLEAIVGQFIAAREGGDRLSPVISGITSVFNELVVGATAVVTAFRIIGSEIGAIMARAGALGNFTKDAEAAMQGRSTLDKLSDPTYGFREAYKKWANGGALAAVNEAAAAERKALVQRQQMLNSLLRSGNGRDYTSGNELDDQLARIGIGGKPKKTAPKLPSDSKGGKEREDEVSKYIRQLTEMTQAELSAETHTQNLDKALGKLASDPKFKNATAEQRAAIINLAEGLDKLKNKYDSNADSAKRWAEAVKEADDYAEKLRESLYALQNEDPDRAFAKWNSELQIFIQGMKDANITAEEQQRILARRAGVADPQEKIQLGLRQVSTLGAAGLSDDAFERLSYKVTEQLSGGVPDAFKEGLSRMEDFAADSASRIDDTLGQTLHDVLTGNFEDIGDSWKHMLENMVVQALQSELSNALFGGFSQGKGFGGLVGSLFPALMGVGARAAGGSTAPGSINRVNEHGPELLSVGGKDYLMAGSQWGKVTPNNALGSGPSMGDTHIHIASGVTRNELAALVPMLKQQITGEVMAKLQRRAG
jgi:hypothetical protein